MIKRCHSPNERGWLALRAALWPHYSREEHRAEMAAWCAEPERYVAFLAHDDAGQALGFAEASIRHDHVNGTERSPVGFLEGIYVSPDSRRRGVARALVAAVEAWTAQAGCRELASDAELENVVSHAMHGALGFEETERVVYFRKPLERDATPQDAPD